MPPDLRILFFGDSFVAGTGDATALGWPGRLVAASHDAGRPITAYNLGVRRDTSADVSRASTPRPKPARACPPRATASS